MSIKQSKEKGFALMTALVFVLVGGAVIVGGIADAVSREVRTVRNEANSKQSYFASESSLEDAIYRIKAGKQIGSTELLTIASTTATSTIVTNGDGSKTIDSTSNAQGTIRTTESSLDTTAGVSFPFALQAGLGGIDMNDGHITGDIYTTGSIHGCGSCTISGAATAAGASTSNLDQDNSSPSTATTSITFANNNSTQDLAQAFSVSQGLSLTDLKIEIKKVGSPSNATIKITTDNSGKPSSSVLASGTLSASLASTTYAWMDIPLTSNPILSAGTTYWIVIDANTNSSNYYIAPANNAVYSGGQAKVGKFGSSWSNTSPSTLDMYFQVYIGTNQAGITGQDQYNRLSVGSAYAYNVSYVNASGALYCQTGTQNTKSCDTSRGDPAIQSDPAADSTILGWKNTAAAGTVNSGDVHVGWQGATIGPEKIVGDLTVDSGGTLIVSGMIWVTGNLTINGGSTMSPQGTGKSYAVVADGTISISGGAQITGGTGGHILLVSTNTADPSITLNGGANDTIVYVPHGGFDLSGGATAKAAAANHITMDGGSTLIYDPSVASLNLTGGSSGGTFDIKSWKETQ